MGDARAFSYKPGLDGIRAVAIAGVLAEHAGFGPGGGLGVLLFFTLSGFLITTLLVQELARTGRIDFRGFYRRRAARLLPAIVVMLLLAAPLAAVTGVSDSIVGGTLTVLFFFADQPWIGRYPDMYGSMWSLSVEEHFYFLWPLILAACWQRVSRRSLLWGVVGVWLAVTVWRSWLVLTRGLTPWNVSHVGFSFDTMADALAAGCLLALVLQRTARRPSKRLLSGASIAAVGLLAVGYLVAKSSREATYLLWQPAVAGIAVVLILTVLYARSSPVGRLLRWGPAVYLGQISYGLYVYNLLLRRFFEGVLGQDMPRSFAPIWAVCVVALAALSFRYVEQPIMGRARGRRTQPTATARSSSYQLVADRT